MRQSWSPKECQERPSPHSPALHRPAHVQAQHSPKGLHLTCHRGDPGGPRGSLPLWDHSPNSPGTCGKALPGRPGPMSPLAAPAVPQCQPPPSAGLGLIATAQQPSNQKLPFWSGIPRAAAAETAPGWSTLRAARAAPKTTLKLRSPESLSTAGHPQMPCLGHS